MFRACPICREAGFAVDQIGLLPRFVQRWKQDTDQQRDDPDDDQQFDKSECSGDKHCGKPTPLTPRRKSTFASFEPGTIELVAPAGFTSSDDIFPRQFS